MDSKYWIKKLSLQKHPEGGYFKEIYRSNESISNYSLPDRFDGDRCFATSIYFLLEKNNFSAFHRIKSDEIWHFYQGESITIYTIDNSGNLKNHKLGNNPENEEELQVVIPRNTWFAAILNKQDSFALVGCTVSPGFNFNDFELAKRELLINLFPQHKEIIEKLTIN